MQYNFDKNSLTKLKKQLEEFTVKLGDSIKDILEKLNLGDEFNRVPEEKLIEELKKSWNLEELELEELTLEKCIELVKSEFNPKKNASACILNKNNIDKSIKFKYEIHICFIDNKNEPILDGGSKRWLIYTNKLDNNLINQFGNKDMIVLK